MKIRPGRPCYAHRAAGGRVYQREGNVRYELGTSWNESLFERLTASRMRSRLDALRSFAKDQNGDGGLAKRVDENHELRDYLHRERAAFMASHSWVEGWI